MGFSQAFQFISTYTLVECPFPVELGWNVGWIGDRFYNSESKINGMQIGTKGIKNLIITMVMKKNFEKTNSKRHLFVPLY
jgi:hypothetical protein